MEWVLIVIGGLLMLTAFICSIIVIVKMFQNKQTGLGIATIVGLVICGFGYILALIFGWKNKDAWGLQTVMPIFTGSFILGLVLYGIGYSILIPKIIKDAQGQMQQMQQQGEMPSFGTLPAEPAPQP